MRRQGIDNDEIQFKSLAEMKKFDEKDVDPDILEMRYSHFSERRNQKIQVLLEEREDLVSQGWKPAPDPHQSVMAVRVIQYSRAS